MAKTEPKYLHFLLSQRYVLNATVFVFEIDVIHVENRQAASHEELPCYVSY